MNNLIFNLSKLNSNNKLMIKLSALSVWKWTHTVTTEFGVFFDPMHIPNNKIPKKVAAIQQ